MNTSPSSDIENTPTPPRKKSSLLKKILKITGLTLLAVILLITVIITVAVSYLQPEKLTPLVVGYANEYLDADLKAERIEISFWSTFPRFDLDIQGLELRTKAFDSLPDSIRTKLPEYADSLLSFSRLNAGINIPRLTVGSIALYDITIDSPKVNLVQATPGSWSLDIFPPSEDKAEDDSPLTIPDFSMGTFRIDGGFPIRYLSLPDSIDVSLQLTTTELQGAGAPVYRLEINGLTSADIASLTINRMQVGMGGSINWSASRPLQTSLSDFRLTVGQVQATINTSLNLEKDLRVESFDLDLPQTPLNHFISLIPVSMRGELDKVDANLSLACAMQLTRPYTVGVDSLPSMAVKVNVPQGSARYDGMSLDRFELQADALIDGLDLNRSTLSISRLTAIGEGMGFTLSGNVTDIMSDPKVNGTFKGGLNVQHLPKSLLSMLPCEVEGNLRADCDFNLRKSYLNNENFHRISIKGNATLSGLLVDMPQLPAHLYSREIELTLGTNSSFIHGDVSVDSLLTASLKIDTISCEIEGLDLRGRGLKMGVGCRNTPSSSDTTQINPIGGRIHAERFNMRSDEDSTRIYLRDATIAGSLSRYKGNARQPQARLNISTGTAIYADRINRAMLSDAKASLTVHPSSSRMAQKRFARYDSLRRAHPGLPADSIRAMASAIAKAERAARKSSNRRQAATDSIDNNFDIEVDAPLRRLLRNWQAEGSLRADRMRMFTPLFPLRNRITGLNVDFSTDSVHIHETQVNVGHSDFALSGSISNITRALTSRTGSQPLVTVFNLNCDTINVNELAGAMFAGAAFAERDSAAAVTIAPLDENTDESALQSSVDNAATTDSTAVLIIPANLEATFDIRANHIVYSDLVFHDFKGTLNAFGGALNLAQLGARSDIGSLNLNALYTAPSRHDASFAFGLAVNGFRIAEFLDLVPAIDSLMPLLNGIGGVINADIAATTNLDSAMNIDIPSLKAAVKLSGDSLVVMDDETFRTIGKWLMFKNKGHNMIDSMTVEMIVDNSQMQMFPFMFNLDRYKLGVMGNNDLAMNFNYHIAVLKSPLPFKFGINVSGNPDNMKIRLGKAKFNEKNMARTISITDTTRINLVQEIRNVFRRGVRNAKVKKLNFNTTGNNIINEEAADTISAADSLYFIREGLIEAPQPPLDDPSAGDSKSKKSKKTKKSKK